MKMTILMKSMKLGREWNNYNRRTNKNKNVNDTLNTWAARKVCGKSVKYTPSITKQMGRHKEQSTLRKKTPLDSF